MEGLFHVKLLEVRGALGESAPSCYVVVVLEVRAKLSLGKTMLKASAAF
jgi:hypothetical protein